MSALHGSFPAAVALPPVQHRAPDLEQRLVAVEQGLARLRRSVMTLEPGSHADTLARTIGDIVAGLRTELLASERRAMAAATVPPTPRPEVIEGMVLDALAKVYRGTWSPNVEYSRGMMTTHGGSLWFATKNIGDGIKPSTDEGHASGWRMVAKGVSRAERRGQ